MNRSHPIAQCRISTPLMRTTTLFHYQPSSLPYGIEVTIGPTTVTTGWMAVVQCAVFAPFWGIVMIRIRGELRPSCALAFRFLPKKIWTFSSEILNLQSKMASPCFTE